MKNSLPPLHQWPAPYRKLVFLFLIVITAGYSAGFANLLVTGQSTVGGVQTALRGVPESELETAEEIVLPKPLRELIITTHNHLLGLSTIFFLVGFLFLHTSYFSPGLRLVLAAEPLLSLLLTFVAMWLTRFVADWFAYLVFLGGVLTHPVFVGLLVANFIALSKGKL